MISFKSRIRDMAKAIKYDFAAIGGATQDISFFTDAGILLDNRRDVLRQKLLAFEQGAKVGIDKFHYTYGGGAANAVVNLANFGFKTVCLAAVGDDAPGEGIRRNLKDRGVSLAGLQVRKKEDSGFSFILISPSGERIIFSQRGANANFSLGRKELAVLKQSRQAYIASLSGDWLPLLRRIFSLPGLEISWNPGAAQYAAGLEKLAPFIRQTKVFALNQDEAIELVISSKSRRPSRDFLDRTDNLLREIKSFGPQIVVITQGAKGVAAYDGQKIYRHAILKEKKRLDTTGVGDIFNSSFVAGLSLYDGDINRALALGLRNTASKIGHLGAQNGLIRINM